MTVNSYKIFCLLYTWNASKNVSIYKAINSKHGPKSILANSAYGSQAKNIKCKPNIGIKIKIDLARCLN